MFSNNIKLFIQTIELILLKITKNSVFYIFLPFSRFIKRKIFRNKKSKTYLPQDECRDIDRNYDLTAYKQIYLISTFPVYSLDFTFMLTFWFENYRRTALFLIDVGGLVMYIVYTLFYYVNLLFTISAPRFKSLDEFTNNGSQNKKFVDIVNSTDPYDLPELWFVENYVNNDPLHIYFTDGIYNNEIHLSVKLKIVSNALEYDYIEINKKKIPSRR